MFKNNFIQVSKNLWEMNYENFNVSLEYFDEEREYLINVSCPYINFNEIITSATPIMAQFKSISLIKNRIDEIVQNLNYIRNKI